MADPIPDAVESFASLVGPDPGPVLAEMDAKAEREGFPTVGPAVGGWLRFLAGTVDAERVFEFGSGFGYSAVWFAGALPADGLVVLTEVDEEELDEAREFLASAGYADRAAFELGDAIETVERYDGPFDCVLVDNEKHRYTEAFAAVREKVSPGGLVFADNAVTAGSIEFEALEPLLRGEARETTEATRGIAEYLRTVRADPAFETVLLPVGEGVAVSRRTR
ncbi:O-methyltransferase [Salinirubellus salinus]|uniref:O-methyltransferase n=1 Tax=Salinirubellus salinus TaxID=1364945 RepID=A0A9E7R5Q8_9EURY|nr:O-methyltransferase [Salinirubellus salinus]UWM55165.1 O-methyltransferase [Salinirubellus salinus]